jgi:hypothetical protein
MLAIAEAYDLISSASIDGIDEIQTISLTDNQKANKDSTICLIQDYQSTNEVQGNNDFFGEANEIEVQIFYKSSASIDPETTSFKLRKIFKKNHWDITDIKELTEDPDTQQLYQSFYFTRHLIY